MRGIGFRGAGWWAAVGLAVAAVGGLGVLGQDAAVAGVTARSVRVSYLAGTVVVTHESSAGGNGARVNMALSQGDSVTTLQDGQAELEFEDGSVARLTPNSRLDLLLLDTNATGTENTSLLRVFRGLVYLEMRASAISRFRVVAGDDSVWPVENAAVRVNMDDPPAVISVLDGSVKVAHGVKGVGFETAVRAGESLRSDAGDGTRYFLAETIAPDTWDNWNLARDQEAEDEMASTTSVRDGYAGTQGYGWSDLDAGGTWYQGADGTPMWQPYEAMAADFDPYGYGSWGYFADAGYTWASGYPWGWVPYHCGYWQYWEGFGWMWQPDGFCRTHWGYGGGVNVRRGPRGYQPVLPPIRKPGGIHPIVPGPHPGQRLPVMRGPHGEPAREIAGMKVEAIAPVRSGLMASGGSVVGSALRRDYPVDGGTNRPVLGVVHAPSQVVVVTPIEVGTAWRSVSTVPEPAGGGGSGGKILGIFGRSEHTSEAHAPVRLDQRGNPYVAPVGRESSERGAAALGGGNAQGGTLGYRPAQGYAAPAQPPRYSAPAAAPQPHYSAPEPPHYSAPPPPPAAPAPVSSGAAAASGKR
jgi:hypothetical protein